MKSEFITIEAAIKLGVGKESIFELLPIYARLPKKVYFTDIEKFYSKECDPFVFLEGIIKIKNYTDLLWDIHNRASLANVTVEQDGKAYLLAAQDHEIRLSSQEYEPAFIDEDCLRVLKQDLIDKIKPSLAIANSEQEPQAGQEKKKQDTIYINTYVTEYRGKISDDEIIYNLRERGYQNNQIGVGLGGTYRKGSNALATKISRKYNAYKKS